MQINISFTEISRAFIVLRESNRATLLSVGRNFPAGTEVHVGDYLIWTLAEYFAIFSINDDLIIDFEIVQNVRCMHRKKYLLNCFELRT